MLFNLGSRPTTILYPFERVPVAQGFRGRLAIVDDLCIGCGKCAQVCPSGCIEMVKGEREIQARGKTIKRKRRPEVSIFQCIRCGLCEEYCAEEPKAIVLTESFSGSGTDRSLLVR
jgi:formate hydrogenlyase subunit 6/NADH:ubiquinone oxidoreductase subunit I